MAAPPSHPVPYPSADIAADTSASPSRKELLSMVKKHSHLIGWTIVDAEDDASDARMDDKFWHEMLDLFFVLGGASNRSEEDDLVFFVNNMKLHGYGFNDNMEDPPPFFVRRWAPTLGNVINANSVEVDWERSFYLNLIAHTSYTVTVAICCIDELRNRADKSKRLSPIYKVLSDPEHCYCVVLNAHDGAAFPEESEANNSSSSTQSGVNSLSSQQKPPKRTLFSGYVSYQNVREAYDAGRSKFGSILSLGHDNTKPDKLYMRGPEGRGEVEVAVSGIADQSREKSKKDPGESFRVFVHRAASAASKLAKHAYESASANKRMDDELVPLKCCLMSVSLPWDYIAHDLLHKDTPPLNL
ncbi:hypothetical protein PR202_gb17675 [Eleusine coracana subsp. coracana]|uniref:Uncharacterized protein n=1 Tax=Eleusine coracana subsp. coracana TaxID=191504 RepID=A0AAV5F3J5_ELECO|nr:hypothetical protein PR202_gb17675 [Eleusine coracana subsp. coracana]